MARSVQRLRRSGFWRSVAVIVTGTLVAQAIGLITLPIISRIYSPQAFGEYAVLTSASLFLTTVVTLGLSSAIMAPEEDAMAEGIVVVAFACAVIFSTVLLALALAFGPMLSRPAGLPLWQSAIFVYVMTIVNGLTSLLRVHTNRRGLNRVLAVNPVLGALCTLVIAIPLGFLQAGSLGLIFASIAAGVLSNLQMLRHANPFNRRVTWRAAISALRSCRDYILFQYPANLLESTGAQLPTQVLASQYGSAKLAAYSMNERLLGIPLRLVGAPISTIYFRSSSQLFRSGGDVANLTFSIVTRVMAVSALPMAALICWGPTLFDWALGREWRDAGALCAYLAPLYVLTLCRASVSYCRVAIGRQRVNTSLSVLRVAIVGLSLVAGHQLFGTIAGAVLALSVGLSVFMLCDMAVNFVLLRRHFKKYVLVALTFAASVLLLWYISGSLQILQ
jgi:O-antigen/teichoic acid export membrane protein